MSHDIHRPENPGLEGECPDCGASTENVRKVTFLGFSSGTECMYVCNCGMFFMVYDKEYSDDQQ